MQYLARAQGFQRTNMPSTPALSVLIFSIIERSVLMAFIFYYKDILER